MLTSKLLNPNSLNSLLIKKRLTPLLNNLSSNISFRPKSPLIPYLQNKVPLQLLLAPRLNIISPHLRNLLLQLLAFRELLLRQCELE